MFRLLTTLILSLSLFTACEGKKKEKEEDPIASEDMGMEEMPSGEEAMAGEEDPVEEPEEEPMPEELDMAPEPEEDPEEDVVDCDQCPEDDACAC